MLKGSNEPARELRTQEHQYEHDTDGRQVEIALAQQIVSGNQACGQELNKKPSDAEGNQWKTSPRKQPCTCRR